LSPPLLKGTEISPKSIKMKFRLGQGIIVSEEKVFLAFIFFQDPLLIENLQNCAS